MTISSIFIFLAQTFNTVSQNSELSQISQSLKYCVLFLINVCYTWQCTAEAQEVTIARAIELKHNPGLISALAHETSKMFTTAADNLHTLDQTKVTRLLIGP